MLRDIGGLTMMEITKLVPKEPRGLVVVITGHGKGKTTTAFGLAVRACGHDMRVCIIQFMKGDLTSGEWDGEKMNCAIELHTTGKDFAGFRATLTRTRHRQNAQTQQPGTRKDDVGKLRSAHPRRDQQRLAPQTD
jgi:cob(I)alamin adenosyltransferase